MLARFLQVDTLVPGAGNTSTSLSAGPQAWDHYVYVNNNPLRFTDPSGHFFEEEGPGLDPYKPTPDPIDLTDDESSNHDGKGAEKIFNEYQRLCHENPGNWYCSTGDSLLNFVSIILSRETFPAWKADEWFAEGGCPSLNGSCVLVFTQAAAQWFWNWTGYRFGGVDNISRSNSTSFRNAALNWLGENMASMWKIIDNGVENLGANLRTTGGKWTTEMLDVAKKVLYTPNPDWKRGGMWSWANASLYTPAGQEIIQDNSIYQYGAGENAWYILNAANVRTMDPFQK